MGNGSSNASDSEERNFEFKCSFMLNGGRFDCVEMEMENPDKNRRIPENKKYLIQQCLNHFKQPITRAGRDTLKENRDWNQVCKLVQTVLCWTWLIGGLFTGLAAGLDIPGMLVVGLSSLIIYLLCAVVLPLYLLPRYNALYQIFVDKVDPLFPASVEEYRSMLDPGFSVRFYKRNTDPPEIFEIMDKGEPWTQACAFVGFMVWVIPFFIIITNFCCLKCFPTDCITYEVHVEFDLGEARFQERQKQQQMQNAGPIQTAMVQPMGEQSVGMAQPMMPGMPGGIPLMTPEQYQHYFHSMMGMNAQNQGASGVAVPAMAMQMGVAEMEVVTPEGEGGEGAAPPAFGPNKKSE